MWTLFCVVALRCQRSVQADNASRIMNAPVDLYSVAVKAHGKPHEQLFKQPVVSRGEIDAVVMGRQRPPARASWACERGLVFAVSATVDPAGLTRMYPCISWCSAEQKSVQ